MGEYIENFKDCLPDPKKVQEIKKDLVSKGVKYIYSNWIDFLGSPKTKPMPISDFEDLCSGKGPQFAVHSVSFVPTNKEIFNTIFFCKLMKINCHYILPLDVVHAYDLEPYNKKKPI